MIPFTLFVYSSSRITCYSNQTKQKNHRNYTLNKNEFKISQFADDTIIILDGSETSLVTALETIKNFFAKYLVLDSTVRKLKPFGLARSKAGEATRLCPGKQSKWLQHIKSKLWECSSTKSEVTHIINYEAKIEKIKKHSEHVHGNYAD